MARPPSLNITEKNAMTLSLDNQKPGHQGSLAPDLSATHPSTSSLSVRDPDRLPVPGLSSNLSNVFGVNRRRRKSAAIQIRDISTGSDGDNLPPAKRRNVSRVDDAVARGFACPFLQRSPKAWSKVACTQAYLNLKSLKDHLKRNHLLENQCDRCWNKFDSKNAFQEHNRAIYSARGCESKERPTNQAEGMSERQYSEIRDRSGMLQEQSTERGKWRAIYHILFPREFIPSPDWIYGPVSRSAGIDCSVESPAQEDIRSKPVPSTSSSAFGSALCSPVSFTLEADQPNMDQFSDGYFFREYHSGMAHTMPSSLPTDGMAGLPVTTPDFMQENDSQLFDCTQPNPYETSQPTSDSIGRFTDLGFPSLDDSYE